MIDSETKFAVDKDSLVLKRENGFSLFMLGDHMTDLNQIVPAVFDVSLQDGQLKSIDEHHVFYTNTSNDELILEYPMMVRNANPEHDEGGVLYGLADKNLRLDGESGSDIIFGHPCLSKKFSAQVQRNIFQFEFHTQNRLLVLANDGRYYAVQQNSNGTFVKHPVRVDNSGIPQILKNQNMTAGEAQYFSEDIIAAGQCAEHRVAFHEISREILSGEENGQSLPTSPDGLTEVVHLNDAWPKFYELNGTSKDIMDKLGAAIFDDEYSNTPEFKPVIFFKNTTAVDASNAKNSEVGWIQQFPNSSMKPHLHLYSDQALLPMVHSYLEGDGIQLRYLVTATRNEPDFVIVGNGGLPSFRMKDPLSALNASQVLSPTFALIGSDAENLAQWDDRFEGFPIAFHCDENTYRNYGDVHHKQDKNVGLLVPQGDVLYRVYRSEDGNVVMSPVRLFNAAGNMDRISQELRPTDDGEHDSHQDNDHNSDHHHDGAIGPSPSSSPDGITISGAIVAKFVTRCAKPSRWITIIGRATPFTEVQRCKFIMVRQAQ